MLEVGIEMTKKSDFSQEVSGFISEGRPTEMTCHKQLNCCYLLLYALYCSLHCWSSQACTVSHTTLVQSVHIVWGHVVIWKIIQFSGEDSRPESGNVICSLSAVFGEKPRRSTLCCVGNTGKISTDWKCISSHIILVAKNEFDKIFFCRISYCTSNVPHTLLFWYHSLITCVVDGGPWIK